MRREPASVPCVACAALVGLMVAGGIVGMVSWARDEVPALIRPFLSDEVRS